MRITGFTARGEARIIDHDGRLVGYGELQLEDAQVTGVEQGDRFALEVVITWTPDMADPGSLDFDDLDWERLLGPPEAEER